MIDDGEPRRDLTRGEAASRGVVEAAVELANAAWRGEATGKVTWEVLSPLLDSVAHFRAVCSRQLPQCDAVSVIEIGTPVHGFVVVPPEGTSEAELDRFVSEFVAGDGRNYALLPPGWRVESRTSAANKRLTLRCDLTDGHDGEHVSSARWTWQ